MCARNPSMRLATYPVHAIFLTPTSTERMREIEKLKSRPIIVCSESGARSSKVSGALKKIGLSDIFVLRGNLTGWAEASLPLEK